MISRKKAKSVKKKAWIMGKLKCSFSLRSFLSGVLVSLVFLGILGICLIFIYHLFFWGNIYPGVRIGGFSLGGKPWGEAINLFSSYVESQKFNDLRLNFDKRVWFIDLKVVGLRYDIQKSVERGYFYGRELGFLEELKRKYLALKDGAEIEAVYKLSEDELKSEVASIGAQLAIPAMEPQIEVFEATPAGEKSRVVVRQGENGRELEEKKVLEMVKKRLAYFDKAQIRLPMVDVKPKLTEEEIERARERAEKLLEKKLLILGEEQKWELKEKDLISFLNFKQGFEEEKIASYAAGLAESIDRKPQSAAFVFDGVKVTEFRPGKDGLTLNQEETRKSLTEKLGELEKGQTKEEKITLMVKKTAPEIGTEEVNNMGIKELLGKGESYFRGSIAGRIHNIDLASSRINGLLVKPGEVFSMNQALGEVSKNTGYQEAYVIKEGRTILGDGGGVCQVSTTLFRAVLRAGLPILERRAHAYRVSYYEQSFPPGQDATVWDPSPDFKFRNDTAATILIQRVFNSGGRYLAFEIYGTSDGRKVEITNSKIWDQTPPPPDLYVDDPTLPTGTVKQIDWKAWGAKVSFGWKVIRGGEVLQDRVFYSAYRPWQAVYLRGPGG